MSSNYSAGQYNDAFSPKRLGNWQIATSRNYNQRPHLSYTSPKGLIIANERGHLLPGVPRTERYDPWGCLYSFCSNGCWCSKQYKYKNPSEMKSSVNNKRYPIPRFYKNKKKSDDKISRPPAAKKAIDPFLNYLRDIQLPTIWIIGMPTDSIKEIRRRITKQLANELDFCYIELEEQILKWTNRMKKFVLQKQQKTNLQGCLKKSSIHQTCNVREPRYRDQKTNKSNKNFIESNQMVNSRKTEEKNKDGKLPVYSIAFDTSERFNTEKVLELLKFAMIEGLPCKGFILDGFPCNLEEAGEFERQFYPSALGMYFTAGTLNAISGFKLEHHHNMKKQDGFLDPIVKPRWYSRKHSYTTRSSQQICNEYGRKIARIIETENVDHDTIDFINELVRKNLEKYPEILSGNAKIDCNPEGDSSMSSYSEVCMESPPTFISTPTCSSRSLTDAEPIVNLPPPLLSCSDSFSSMGQT